MYNATRQRPAKFRYPWHPWAGCIVHIHEVIEKAAGDVVRCSHDDDVSGRLLELPTDDAFSPFLPFSLLRLADVCGARPPPPTPAARFLRFPAHGRGGERREHAAQSCVRRGSSPFFPRENGGRNGENGWPRKPVNPRSRNLLSPDCPYPRGRRRCAYKAPHPARNCIKARPLS